MNYQNTHPWISFTLNLLDRQHELWLLLGEVKSKCDHLANEILEPVTAERLHIVYLAKGALATNAIEGNTLTETDALRRVEGTLELPPSQEYLGQEIDNIIQACNLILEDIRRDAPPELNTKTIEDFNRMVLDKLKLDDRVVPGQIRSHSVAVANLYQAPQADECSHLLERLCEWLNSDVFRAVDNEPHMTIPFATIKAVLAHLYLAWIHPFGDGNGRTARLLEFAILVSSGVPSPAAHLLSNHYNLTRTEYYRQLAQAVKPGGDVEFLKYAVQGFVDGLQVQLRQIRGQQWKLAWRSYVHDLLPEGTTKNDRRRHLVLDLTEKPEGAHVGKLREVSPRVATSYANKSVKTLVRDVVELRKMGLLKVKDDGMCKANKTKVLGMRPFTARSKKREPTTEKAKPPSGS